MTERKAQIEALWTYEISTEKILRRAVKKGFISQAEADEFSEKLFEQLDAHGRCASQSLYLFDGNCQRKENVQSELFDSKLDAEQYYNRISADVGEDLQPTVSRGCV